MIGSSTETVAEVSCISVSLDVPSDQSFVAFKSLRGKKQDLCGTSAMGGGAMGGGAMGGGAVGGGATGGGAVGGGAVGGGAIGCFRFAISESTMARSVRVNFCDSWYMTS